MIVAEDGRFCSHHGVDFAEIRDAIDEADDLDELRGGSTITQQVAKNLFLWPGRSYLRKALEFPLALWIDLVLSKRRILEIYLNIAEWGPNGEFGVEAGGRYAFGKPARELSPLAGRDCWPPCCPTRTSATRAGPGRACGGWPGSMSRRAARAPEARRVPARAPTSLAASHPL